MKEVVEYHIVDDLGKGDTDFMTDISSKFYAGGIRIGYLRAASIITELVEGLTVDQKTAIYELMDKAFNGVKVITIEREVKE